MIVFVCLCVAAIDEQNNLHLMCDDEAQLKRLRCSDDVDTVVIADNDTDTETAKMEARLFAQNTDSSDAENALSPPIKSDDNAGTVFSFVLNTSETQASDRLNSLAVSGRSADIATTSLPVASGGLSQIPVIKVDGSSPVFAGESSMLSRLGAAGLGLPRIEVLCTDEMSSTCNGNSSEYPTSPSSLSADDGSSESSEGKSPILPAAKPVASSGVEALGVLGGGGGVHRRPPNLLPLPIPTLQLPDDGADGHRGFCHSAPLSPVIEAHSPCKSRKLFSFLSCL